MVGLLLRRTYTMNFGPCVVSAVHRNTLLQPVFAATDSRRPEMRVNAASLRAALQ